MTRSFQPFEDMVEECLKQRNDKCQGDLSDLGLFKEEHDGNDMCEGESSRVDIREWERERKWVK